MKRLMGPLDDLSQAPVFFLAATINVSSDTMR